MLHFPPKNFWCLSPKFINWGSSVIFPEYSIFFWNPNQSSLKFSYVNLAASSSMQEPSCSRFPRVDSRKIFSSIALAQTRYQTRRIASLRNYYFMPYDNFFDPFPRIDIQNSYYTVDFVWYIAGRISFFLFFPRGISIYAYMFISVPRNLTSTS